MPASIMVRLVVEVAGGHAVYAWAEAGEGRQGWLLFCPPQALFRECDAGGAADPEGMALDLASGELTHRHPEHWRPFLQAAYGIWKRYRDSGTGALPRVADRVFF